MEKSKGKKKKKENTLFYLLLILPIFMIEAKKCENMGNGIAAQYRKFLRTEMHLEGGLEIY